MPRITAFEVDNKVRYESKESESCEGCAFDDGPRCTAPCDLDCTGTKSNEKSIIWKRKPQPRKT